jgi:sugar phosphate isomerase/epimerase
MKTIHFLLTIALMIQLSGCKTHQKESHPDLFSKENLVAWCIVPFDANRRTPEERATMLNELGISQLAYDYRDEHIPYFKEEIGVLKVHGIGLRAVWLWIDPPEGDTLNDASRSILGILEETGTKTELWVSFPPQVFEEGSDEERVDRAVKILTGVLHWADRNGCTIALYNHGDWFGEPENQVRIIKALGPDRVRLVYNFHHGHHQVDRFGELMELMLPYLSAININGMKVEGPKIITLGEGDRELEMLKVIAASGYNGSIGILGHTEGEDIRVVLERNLEGLGKLKKEL